jgi:hypothetical protein
MADLAQIAQSGVDPISGSYLSAEKRKALFKRSKVSSNIFGGGGAIVPISKKSDPETLAIAKSQSSSITSVQQQVNTLSSEVANLNKVIFIQTQTVNGVQELVGSLRGEVTGFNSSLNNVAKAINADSVLEQNRVKKENEEQRRATELGLRAGRESLLEKAIQNALIAPVRAIAQKTQSILSRLAQFFGTLLLGWLTNQGIETLKALSEDNGKKLIEIRDNVLKALGIGAATLFLLNGGFFAIAGTITRLSLKIGGWLLKNTIGRFFGALGGVLTGAGAALFGLGKQKPPETTIVPPTTTPPGAKPPTAPPPTTSPGTKPPTAPPTTPKGAGPMNWLKGKGGLLNILFGGFEFGSRKLQGQTDVQAGAGAGGSVAGSIAGATAGAKLGLLGGPISPITVPVASLIGGGFGWYFGGKGADVLTGADKPEVAKTSAAKPQSPVIPSSTKSTQTPTPAATTAASDKPFEQQMSDLKAQANSIDFTQAPQYGEVNITPEDNRQVSSQSTQVNIKPLPAQTERISTQVNVGPAPAPAPNVIYRRVGSSAQQRSGAAPTGGPVNEVPSISASNPDNFYVLYSQVNYNVVT